MSDYRSHRGGEVENLQEQLRKVTAERDDLIDHPRGIGDGDIQRIFAERDQAREALKACARVLLAISDVVAVFPNGKIVTDDAKKVRAALKGVPEALMACGKAGVFP